MSKIDLIEVDKVCSSIINLEINPNVDLNSYIVYISNSCNLVLDFIIQNEKVIIPNTYKQSLVNLAIREEIAVIPHKCIAHLKIIYEIRNIAEHIIEKIDDEIFQYYNDSYLSFIEWFYKFYLVDESRYKELFYPSRPKNSLFEHTYSEEYQENINYKIRSIKRDNNQFISIEEIDDSVTSGIYIRRNIKELPIETYILAASKSCELILLYIIQSEDIVVEEYTNRFVLSIVNKVKIDCIPKSCINFINVIRTNRNEAAHKYIVSTELNDRFEKSYIGFLEWFYRFYLDDEERYEYLFREKISDKFIDNNYGNYKIGDHVENTSVKKVPTYSQEEHDLMLGYINQNLEKYFNELTKCEFRF
ncbi:hypothetical protein A6P54_02575 [Bacillus sp. MKU004]|nr:hypothetical protein A6P54_02575 [Bacillus sp. MKU004]